MIEIKLSTCDEKSTFGDGKPIVYLRCPKCGNYAALDEHSIAADGTVSPSVVCPFDKCDFHDHVRLIDYSI